MFFRNIKSFNRITLQAVPIYRSHVEKHSKHSDNLYGERTSRCTSGLLCPVGSLTVEVSLAFPLFLAAAVSLLYLFIFLRLQTEIGRGLTEIGKELGQYAYIYEKEAGEGELKQQSVFYVKQKLQKRLETETAVNWIVGGASGISCLGCKILKTEAEIDLRVSYKVKLPPGVPWVQGISITQRKFVRAWIGLGAAGRSAGEEEIVYLTEYGTVYHTTTECRHLKLSVRQTTWEDAKEQRNGSGSKYYPCELCWKAGSSLVFITEEGNRCHERLNCPGLVRRIYTKLLSEVGGMPACSVCGG